MLLYQFYGLFSAFHHILQSIFNGLKEILSFKKMSKISSAILAISKDGVVHVFFI